MPYPHRDSAFNGGSTVSVTVASTAVVAVNESRLTLIIVNNGSAAVFLQFQSSPSVLPTATLAGSMPLAAGAALVTNDFTGAVAGIVASATNDIRVVEI